MGDSDVALKSTKRRPGRNLGNLEDLLRDAPDISGCHIDWDEVVSGCDLSYLIPKKDAPDAAGQSFKLGKSSNNQDGVKSYTTIMGYCDNNFGVIAADSLVSQDIGPNTLKTNTGADKVIQITPFVGLVGSGVQPVFVEVADQIEKLGFKKDKKANAATVKDVVVWVVRIIKNSIESVKMKDPTVTDHRVSYILVGKTHQKCEMYTIANDFDNDRVFASRCSSRIVNGGSGEKELAIYQKKHPLRSFASKTDVVNYFFKCMQEALLKDERSGGDINMVLIDDEFRLIPFNESVVYGHQLFIPKRKKKTT